MPLTDVANVADAPSIEAGSGPPSSPVQVQVVEARAPAQLPTKSNLLECRSISLMISAMAPHMRLGISYTKIPGICRAACDSESWECGRTVGHVTPYLQSEHDLAEKALLRPKCLNHTILHFRCDYSEAIFSTLSRQSTCSGLIESLDIISHDFRASTEH